MKRVGNLYTKMLEESNIRQAILNASRNKDKKPEVQRVLSNLDFYIKDLKDLLLNESFTPTAYKTMHIKSEGKDRLISILPFYPDRCVQHLIALVMLPKWNQYITDDTYASWKGRGIACKDKVHSFVHKTRSYIKRYKSSPYLYCLKFDIKKCYQSVESVIMDKINSSLCKDKRLLSLMSVINNSSEGLAIGNYISQLWVNVLLTKLDRFIKQVLRVKEYCRYMDDCILLSDSKKLLHEWLWRIKNFLWYELHLELNSKTQIFPVGSYRGQRGIDICGYVFFRDFTLLRKRIKKNIIKKLNCPKSMASYKGLLMQCDSVHFQNKFNI